MKNMEDYKKQLNLAKKTGKGIACKFQQKPTYEEVVDGYKCPYCNAEYGEASNCEDGGKPIVFDHYETPVDVEFMCNHVGYSWTEDCKCGNCGKMYSRGNGC